MDTPAANDAIGLDTPADPRFFTRLDRPVDFYLMRHGESEGNAAGRIQGRRDFPLSENGRAQARAAAAWLGSRGIGRVLASPLARAYETASIVAAELGLAAPLAEPLLMELDTGVFSGLAMAEIRERYPEDYARFKAESWAGVSGAESVASLEARAIGAWRRMRDLAAAGEGQVLAVSHGGTMQWLVRACFGCRSWLPILPTGNCAVYRLSVEPAAGAGAPFVQWRELNERAAAALPSVAPLF